MSSNYDEPLPPGVQCLPNASPQLVSSNQSANHPPPPSFQNFANVPQHGYYPENNHYHNYPSNVSHAPLSQNFHPQYSSQQHIETAAQDAVLREQDIAMQKVILDQREGRAAIGSHEENSDIFAGRHDPNDIKEHLLKMTEDHRSQMAIKRGKPASMEGNLEIGNGYGVPGGGAYYGASRPDAISSGSNGNEKHESDQSISEQPNTNNLPEFLKQKLKARGILKDESNNKLNNQVSQSP